ncbi:hypothetical protein PBV87_15440 [Niameybacter massiliensis]|uniref:Uncharacterized protein n=1 Tax=Holtiella tumoricola TaxID=3018743 RepID=A0AA42DPQ7_9FIRM|nr:hypothetical protein [Holtiella tumoricola]MDA3732870.1 hypothetical protein [Holtiella tumoricola]
MKSIEQLQKEKNETNLKISELLKVSPSTYCDKKKGRRKFQPMEIVILCKYFNVTVEEVSDFLIRDTR